MLAYCLRPDRMIEQNDAWHACFDNSKYEQLFCSMYRALASNCSHFQLLSFSIAPKSVTFWSGQLALQGVNCWFDTGPAGAIATECSVEGEGAVPKLIPGHDLRTCGDSEGKNKV